MSSLSSEPGSLRTKRINHAVTLLSRVKEENRWTETIGSAWVMTVWRQISSSSSEGILGVKWNSLGHAALLRWSYSQDHSTIAYFPRAQWITIHVTHSLQNYASTLGWDELYDLQHSLSNKGLELAWTADEPIEHYRAVSPRKYLIRRNTKHHLAMLVVDRLHELHTNLTWVWSTSLPVPPWFQRLP